MRIANYDWSIDATLRHGSGPEQAMDWAPLPPEWTGDPTQDAGALMDSQDGSVLVRQTFAGSDAPSGTWTLTIARLVGYDGEGATTRLEGPWVFTVQIP